MSKKSSEGLLTSARLALLRNVRELNLFSNDPLWTPTLKLSEQILSTRLLIFFISISLLIVIIYASLIIQTHTVTLEKFSLSTIESLQTRYPTTINIPCTQVSIPYHRFITLQPNFHQICSSSFIDDSWIASIFLPNATSYNAYDFHTFSFAQFQALALLCHTSKQAILDGYQTFNSTNLVTNYLFSRAEFNEIVGGLLTNLQNNILANENRTARIVSMNIAQNRIISALRTNVYIRSIYLSNIYMAYNGYYYKKNRTTCRCPLETTECFHPAGAFYNWTARLLDEPADVHPLPPVQIPGLMAGCLPLESLRHSTLECLYDQSCVDILAIQPEIFHPKALQKSPSSKFSLETTIGMMFDKSLFVESWQPNTSFEDYFTTCSPRSLTYTYQGRSRLPAIITICVSAFGGLVIAWQMITPAIVHLWTLIKRKRDTSNTSIPPINEVVTKHVHRTIRTLNLFPPDDENDQEEQRVGIIATRLYFFLLLLGFLVLGCYTFLSERTQQITVRAPSLAEYERLQTLYSSTLICSCTRFSMSYNRILSISPRYHQICSSPFLKSSWLAYFNIEEITANTTFFPPVDFRFGGQSFFDLLRVLCQTSEETVSNAIHLFRSRRLISINTLSRSEFHQEIQTRLSQFQQRTVSSFTHLLELVRSSIQTNRLVADLLTTTGFSYLLNKQTMTYSPRFYSRNIGNCSCAITSECTRPQGFYLRLDLLNAEPKTIIPGLVLGCYTIDSLLFSTLECLFEKKCLKLIISMRDFNASGLFHPMDKRVTKVQPLRRNNSRFQSNTTLQSIMSELFIEDWRTSNNFTAYYHRCAPKECIYTLRRRFDTAYMIAIMLGFYSGLSAILEIVLPSCVRVLRQQWKKTKVQKESLSPSSTITTENSSRRSFNEIRQSIRSWNLFSTNQTAEDSRFEHQEIVATRLYSIFFLIIVIAALLYAGPFSEEIKTTVIKSPSSDDVNNLYLKNISTLSCPCSTAAVQHSKFLSITPHYHSVCSSIYATPLHWIELSKKTDKTSLLLTAHYRLLSSFCQIANRTIHIAQHVFNTQELVSIEPMSRSSFAIQTEALVSTFIAQIPADYRRTLHYIMRSFSVNHLFNIFTSNWKPEFTDEEHGHVLATFPRRFPASNCTCATSFNCIESITEDIVSGCFPFDGFRLSTYENLSLGELNDNLFVTQWHNESNYTAYFQTCHPLECRYTLPDRNNAVYMFMTVLGLYGGLICMLRLMIHQSLHIYRWLSRHRENVKVEVSTTESM
ncbi:unnamed protein product [Adineta ricciae]|uniref:Uncharacterized protein n=1 Tax=Adineta ricciae TaxID=249248 RepID=A0A815HAI1_ADIRI|nr:unnamed protein product [Adineta ricciae]CAF1348927.1 unnamed protein product [Adineta ricciae]